MRRFLFDPLTTARGVIWLAAAVGLSSCHWFRGSAPDAAHVDGSASDVDYRDGSAHFDGSRQDAVSFPCGLARDCDPIRGTGCPPGTSCTVIDWAGAQFECRPRGTLWFGDPCTQSVDCGAGLQCHPEHHMCLRLCCPLEGDGLCGQGSYCSTPTVTTPRVSMCTLRGECDTVDAGPDGGGGCAVGACYPTAPWGDNSCYVPGSRGVGDPCAVLFGCREGLVCALPPHDGGTSPTDAGVVDGSVVADGFCRVRCRYGVDHCAVGTCTPIQGFPTDVAACIL